MALLILVITLLVGLASYRLWRLVGEDSITEALRARLPEPLLVMVACPWCLGSWVAFGVTWLTDATIGIEMPVLVALAAAVVVGWLGENL